MKKKVELKEMGITVNELTVKQIAALFDADEKVVLAFIFGGDAPKMPDVEKDGEFMRRMEIFCGFCVGMTLEELIKKCFSTGWAPSDLMELWEAFSKVNRPLVGLPETFGVKPEVLKKLLKTAGPRIEKSLNEVFQSLSDPDTEERPNTG